MGGIVIRGFEGKDQREVAELYRLGMTCLLDSNSNSDFEASVRWFTDDRLNNGGDMFDLQNSYMANAANGSRKFFWVAIDLKGKIVACVGAKPSTKFNIQDYCELVRLTIHPDLRNKGQGTRLIEVVEQFAKDQGYKYVHLSTFTLMSASVSLFKKRGYTCTEEEQYDMTERLNSTCPVMISVSSFIKELE